MISVRDLDIASANVKAEVSAVEVYQGEVFVDQLSKIPLDPFFESDC